jgi:hypothetical protein
MRRFQSDLRAAFRATRLEPFFQLVGAARADGRRRVLGVEGLDIRDHSPVR